MSPKKDVKNLAEPEFGRTIKLYIWEHGDIYGKCHEVFINPNQLRTWNSILIYLTNIINPIFGAIRNLVSIKTKKYINCFKDLENSGRYVVLGIGKNVKFTENKYKTGSEMEMELVTKKPVKRFYSGDIGESEFKFLCATQKRKLTIIYVLVNALTCQTPSKVVLTGNDLLVWDTTLDYLAKILDVPNGIQHLCTIFGDIIFEPNELQHGYVYVALPYNEKFVDMDYLSYFNELEDSYKKKGLLLSIRPAQEKKYGKKIPKLKTVKKKKKLQMEGKKSVTNSDAGDGVQIRSQVQIGDKTAENECQCDPFNTCMNSAKTQTLHNVQDDAVVNSQLHNGNSIKYVNKSVQIREKKNQTAVPTSGLTTKMDRFSGETKRTENKPEPITQRDSGLKDTTDINTSTPVIKANKSDIKEKAIEHFSISVVVSKTTKVVNEIKTEHNISNLDLSKTCQACTYCTNIAVSGTCSDKLEVITNIINDVIIDTYKRLMQTDDLKKDDNLVPIEDTTKKSITINGGGSVTDSKVERISAGNVDSATDEVKENSIVAPTMKEAKNISEKNKISATDTIRDKETKEKLSIVQDMKDTMEFSKINSSKPSGSKNYKVNESNYIYSGCGHVPSVHIKNKTYFNFCDLKSCPRNSCKDIRIRYCKKSSSDLDKTCYLYEMTPKVKEFQCNSCTAAPVDEIDMMDRFSKGEKQDISKTIKKKTVLYKSVSEKVQLGSVTTQTQTQSKIQSGLYMYSQGTAEKPIQDSMSLDSISGDVSDTKINEPTKKEDTNDIQDESEQLKYRDEVSIAVNISKVNGSKNPFEDHKISEQYLKTETPVNTERGNEISISKVTSNASFLEKLTYIKDIINSILKEVFELQNNEALKTEGIESITKKQENGNIYSDSRAQKDITENSTVGVSNYSNKDTSKMTFNKMDEHQYRNVAFALNIHQFIIITIQYLKGQVFPQERRLKQAKMV
ncbi:uncharacterized protein LOC108916732 isoform X2 [Anoplophora glabripennis]|uniref:uncharacterized protein LOC108916732 isoform X2 n=1 Tax=Anoplophora glabripennis TaxID=217634 RepID=UPI00087375A2|nr:uncharacterized protein LOC108916732 isoform X2 [Anoplophora glabripennis]